MKFGKEAFILEILETLEKKPEQTSEEFKEDLKELKKVWLEKLDVNLMY